MSKKIYVIGNSHMDPIWIWRLREGRSTWLNTCRSVVRMMKKYPFLKFARSSSVCYRWVEESDPALFREIRKLVDAGRWELVGGWVEQSDTIITPGESLLRQAEHGKAYFKEKFGRDVRIAYSVDSFGQNIGLPKILKASGFDRYVWMRPQEHEKSMPHIFRWKCDDNSGDVLSFRIRNAYCTPPDIRGNTTKELFRWWFERGSAGDDEHQTFFFGVGDHGGGIYEKQLKWLLELGEDYELIFSTLEEYFNVIDKLELPVVDGEHTHHAPGCYSAVGGVKLWMANAEKNLYKAEKILLQSNFRDKKETVSKLYNAWEEHLFNYFHDVYPGTSIRAAYENEVRDLCGMVNKTAVDILEKSFARIGSAIKTDFLKEGGMLFWNPLPQSTVGNAFAATFSDPNAIGTPFNCLRDSSGREIPLQWIRNVTAFGLKGGVFTDEMAPSEVKAYAYGRTDKEYPSVGFERQHALLKRLRFDVVSDKNDTWAHAAKELGKTLGQATLKKVEEQENGPVVSRLRCFYSWKKSTFYLDLFAWKNIAEVEAVFLGNWQQKREALKLVLDTQYNGSEIISGQALASITRTADVCEQPFLDYVSAGGNGFFAHALHSYDSIGGKELRLTVLRPVVYAQHDPHKPNGDEGYADLGYQERRFWIFTGAENTPDKLNMAARKRLWNCEHFELTAASNGRKFQWDSWEVQPQEVVTTAQRYNKDGSIDFRLYNPGSKEVKASILRNGGKLAECTLKPSEFKLITLNK